MPKKFVLRRKKKAKKPLKKLVKKVNELWNTTIPEYKFYTIFFNASNNSILAQTALNTGVGATISNLTPVGTRGTSVNQFIGDQYMIHKINIRLFIHSGNLPQPTRLIIFRSRAGTLETPTPAFLLVDGIVQTNNAQEQFISDFNPDYVRPKGLKHLPPKKDYRYEILLDKVVYSNHNGSGDNVYRKDLNFKKPILITQSVANVIKGDCIWAFLSHGYSTTAADNPLMAGEATIFYTDQ